MYQNLSYSGGWAGASGWAIYKGKDNKSGDLGLWRLPTQRELRLMFKFKDKLEGSSDFGKFSLSHYYSATEHSTVPVWFWGVDFDGKDANFVSKVGKTSTTRCVRDID